MMTARTTPEITIASQNPSSRNHETSNPNIVATTPTVREEMLIHLGRLTATGTGRGGSTVASGSAVSEFERSPGRKMSSANSTRNGNPGRRPVAKTLFVGSDPARTACNIPKPMAPKNVSGMLLRPPTTVAARAATRSVNRSIGLSDAKRGATSTPASPAIMDESIQDAIETRSAFTPLSSASRGLSTTARIRSPRLVYRNNTVRPTTTTNVETMVVTCPASKTNLLP